MGKKKQTEMETELRALLPEQVQECAQELAALIVAHKAIKTRAKASARDFKTQLESNEEQQERLSRMVITQQEEVPVQRQMSLAEIEDQRRHELSISESSPLPDEIATPVSADEAPGSNTPDGGLLRALNFRDGANGRWEALRESGATDAELRGAIAEAFGAGGTSSGEGLKPVSFKGGEKPAFWLGVSPPAKPTLTGKALVARVREVLAIPLAITGSGAADADTTNAESEAGEFSANQSRKSAGRRASARVAQEAVK